MPVVVRPNPSRTGTSRRRPDTKGHLLRQVSFQDQYRKVLHTSLSEVDNSTVVAYGNGFVETVMRAWQQDLHLVLRPDDVWLAVLTQLGFFINGQGRAEALRHHFVAHEGQSRLVLECPDHQTIQDIDMPSLAGQFAALVKDRLVDPGLTDWLLPTFTTTTPHDLSVAASVFLGTMRQYFNYDVIMGCGFPSVTLHGERSDWVVLATGVSRLADLATGVGDEDARSLQHWSRCLRMTVESMIYSFDRPDDDDVRDFWMRACHTDGEGGSGQTVILSGWLTAFTWWRADGTRQKAYTDDDLREMWHLNNDWNRLELGGVEFPVVNQGELPAGFTRTPIAFHHKSLGNSTINTELLAGSCGMKLIDEAGSRVQPFSCWWLLTDPAWNR